MLSDAQLVERVLGGDREAFGSLVSRYERTILSIALAELHDLQAAEDVVQSAFLSAFVKLATLKESDKFGVWLVQIARRQVVDHVRQRRATVPISSETTLSNFPSRGPEMSWIEQESVLDLMAKLPDHEQILIGLRHFDGLSMTEIAIATGRPVGTVTKQLSRAIEHLREWWNKEPKS